MRFFLVAAIWLVLVGGLALYTYQRDRMQHAVVAAEPVREAQGESLTLELTPSFTTSADPYALEGRDAKATVLVRAADRELFASDNPIPAGVTRTVHPVQGLVLGLNEIYVRAVPPQGEAKDHALRVKLLRGGEVLLDRTLWGEKGAVVAGSIPFELKESGGGVHER